MESKSNKPKSFIIENFGCQMNVADSTETRNSLIEMGFYEAIDEFPDVVILNSCAVRGSAEERILGRLRHYSQIKAKQDFTLVLMGCVAQKEKENILEVAPHVDLVIGTHYKNRLPSLLNNIIINKTKQVFGDFGDYHFDTSVPSTKYPFKANLTIIHGCNKYCSYCIVPYTRGIEISRQSDEIIENVKELVDQGVTEIQLLGQNVNSYGQDNNDITFAELLQQINRIEGLKRIRFLTSHPKDFTSSLIDTIRSCDKVCKYIHLPLQSASNNILEKMNREYTYEHYLSIINELKGKIPEVVLSTDILVGFPFETEQDFEMTYNAVKDIRYYQSFMFKYSIREGTQSASYPDTVEKSEKIRRLQLIIDLQHQITKEENRKEIGKIEEVLLESISKNDSSELIGKTESNKPVVVKAEPNQIGQYKIVHLKELKGNTFVGEFVN